MCGEWDRLHEKINDVPCRIKHEPVCQNIVSYGHKSKIELCLTEVSFYLTFQKTTTSL